MTIFFNGCSMVFGKDLVPQTIEQENDPDHPTNALRKVMAWPRTCADHLNMESVNVARPGASMDCIVRATYEQHHWSYGYAVIGLTEPLRFEYVDPYTESYSQVVLPRGSYKKMYSREMRKFIEDTAWYQFTDHASMVQYAINILALQSYFLSTGVKYYFVNSLADYVTPCLEALPWFEAKFDPSCWDSSTSMYDLCRSEGVRFGSTVHPLREGHALFAKHVAKRLEAKWRS